MTKARLERSSDNRMIAGVCGGLAEYLAIDPALVRLAFVILLFASGIGFPLYLILWIIMPREESTQNSGDAVFQENIGEMKETISSNVGRVGRPATVGIMLVLLGVYFLFAELGWMAGWASGVFWPFVIIGFGVFLLIRRSR